MEGQVRLEDSVLVLPDSESIAALLPLLDAWPFSGAHGNGAVTNKGKAYEHCIKVIETMMRNENNYGIKKAEVLMNRPYDTYFSLRPHELYDVFPVLYYEVFKADVLKAMNFMKAYSLFCHSGIVCNVSTSFKDMIKGVKIDNPDGGGTLKIMEFSDDFKKLPKKERLRRILRKDALEHTIVDFTGDLLGEFEKVPGSKLVIYKPRLNARYSDPYDMFRAAAEAQVCRQLERKFGKHPQLEIKDGRSISNLIEELKKNCYSRN